MSRILVVEDEPEIRENIEALLELEGHEVIPAENGKKALAELQNDSRFDLILLDLSMPVMNGTEFLAAVANSRDWSTIPVCITTGVAELPEFNRAVDILRKPISFQELIRQINKYSLPSYKEAA